MAHTFCEVTGTVTSKHAVLRAADAQVPHMRRQFQQSWAGRLCIICSNTSGGAWSQSPACTHSSDCATADACTRNLKCCECHQPQPYVLSSLVRLSALARGAFSNSRGLSQKCLRLEAPEAMKEICSHSRGQERVSIRGSASDVCQRLDLIELQTALKNLRRHSITSTVDADSSDRLGNLSQCTREP